MTAKPKKTKVARLLKFDTDFIRQCLAYVELQKKNGTISSFAQLVRIALFEKINK